MMTQAILCKMLASSQGANHSNYACSLSLSDLLLSTARRLCLFSSLFWTQSKVVLSIRPLKLPFLLALQCLFKVILFSGDLGWNLWVITGCCSHMWYYVSCLCKILLHFYSHWLRPLPKISIFSPKSNLSIETSLFNLKTAFNLNITF